MAWTDTKSSADLVKSDDWNKMVTYQKDYNYITLFPVGCMVPTTNPAGIDQAESGAATTNYVYGAFSLAGENTEQLQWLVNLPADWTTGGNITAKFYWTVDTGTGTHTVKWQLAGVMLPDNTALATAYATIGAIQDAIQTQKYVHTTSATTGAIISGSASDLVAFQVKRVIVDSGTDTTSDARLIAVQIKYSRTPAT